MMGRTLALDCFDVCRFVFTVLCATWIFVRGVSPRKPGYQRRAALVLTTETLLCAAYIPALVHARIDTQSALPVADITRIWILCTFLFALFAAKYCRDISWTNALSRWLLGICVERFITAFVHNWLFLIIIPGFKTEHPAAYMAVCAFTYTLFLTLAALTFAPIFRHAALPGSGESRTLCMLYTVSFLALYVISNLTMHISEYWVPHLREEFGNNAGFDTVLWFSTSMAGVIAAVIFLFQYAIYHTTALRQETAMLNLLAEQKSRQYATLSDNIEFINRKTHDLKHQVAALEFTDDARRSAMVREVQQALDLYDSRVETGNDALDTLITERNFHCVRHGIRLSCMLKGCDWGAFDVVDLFTLIGNALDNAFEYVERFDDPDKRVVSLTARQHGNLIVISVDNHFEGTLELRDGLPTTTKSDKSSHGLGLKSIRRIARRYGGDIQVSAEPPIFTLRISLMAAGR